MACRVTPRAIFTWRSCRRSTSPSSSASTRPAKSDRHVAADLDAAHQAPERPGIAQRNMLGAAIVPEGDRALLPAEAEGEFRPVAVLHQEVEQGLALGRCHALEAHRVGLVDE